MACVFISIENETILGHFHSALNRAGSVASDMIEVKTQILDGALTKVIRTDCPSAIAVFRALNVMEQNHD